MFSEADITSHILREAVEELSSLTRSDVVVVGAGPAGMTAAKYLADAGFRVVVFERRLSFGGGIGGGGMLFHKIVVENPADKILKEIGVRLKEVSDGLYVADAAEMMAKLAASCIDSGAKIIHGVTVNDVVYRDQPLRICGVAIQWGAVQIAGLHVDPLLIESKAVVDATGHDAEVVTLASKKIPELNIIIQGEKSAYSKKAEKLIVDYTGKVVEGLYVAGMAVAAVHGLPRMGPIFGGMLLSGKKVADIIAKDLRT